MRILEDRDEDAKTGDGRLEAGDESMEAGNFKNSRRKFATSFPISRIATRSPQFMPQQKSLSGLRRLNL